LQERNDREHSTLTPIEPSGILQQNKKKHS